MSHNVMRSQEEPSTLLDREEELLEVDDLIENIATGISDHFILLIQGYAGMGKSSLLKQIWYKTEFQFPTAIVGVQSLRRGDGIDREKFVSEILSQLSERLPRRVFELLPEAIHSTDLSVLTDQFRTLSRAAAAYGKPCILLIDDYDQLVSRSEKTWLEAEIISPAIKNGQTAVILSSRTNLELERLDLRLRTKRRELTSFTEETIARTFPNYKELAGDILRVTGGLPFFADQFVKDLEQFNITSSVQLQAHETEVFDAYYRPIVEETIFPDLDPEWRAVISALAILRRFDIKLLKGILPKVLANNHIDHLTVFERLGNQIKYGKELHGYTISPGLRMVLATYTRSRQPRLYEKVTRAAIQWYRREIQVEYREYYLTELLYHKLVLLTLNEHPSQQTIEYHLKKELDDHLTTRVDQGANRIVDLDSLRNALLHDPDLARYMTPELISGIQDQIGRYFMPSVIQFPSGSDKRAEG